VLPRHFARAAQAATERGANVSGKPATIYRDVVCEVHRQSGGVCRRPAVAYDETASEWVCERHARGRPAFRLWRICAQCARLYPHPRRGGGREMALCPACRAEGARRVGLPLAFGAAPDPGLTAIAPDGTV
jgi:hypothetical protein